MQPKFRVTLPSFALCLLAGATFAPAQTPVGLMPLPAKMTSGSGSLRVTADFVIASPGETGPVLRKAIGRLRTRISRATGMQLLPESAAAPKLIVECRAAVAEAPRLGEDESYTLDVTSQQARLTAASVTGALRGLATFAQLVASDGEGFGVAATHIEDSPRFPWRGLLIDSGRHFIAVTTMERNLDAMEAVKLNVLHWHLSEDQGFRVESKKYPKLHQLGSDGLYYTQEEIRHIVDYARERAIRVVPEFDVPGHSTSTLVAYPELGSAPGPYTIGRDWGIYQPVLDPTNEKVYEFLEGFFTEMIALFPDEYFHIGGDEVLDKHWKANAKIQQYMAAHKLNTVHDLQAYFNTRVQAILARHGRKMVGWDEILRPDLPKDIVIQSWRGAASLTDAVLQGYRGILSTGYYLDHLKPAGYHYPVDPLGGKAATLTPEQAKGVLGGEACMWTEYTTDETLDSHIWPRTAVMAERYWSPREVTDIDSMYARMEQVSRSLAFMGLRHRSYTSEMLSRLAGAAPLAALEVLGRAVESDRLDLQRKRKFTSRVPMYRLADAVPPESEEIRRLQRAARDLTPADRVLLNEALTAWRDNYGLLQPAVAGNFLLKEAAPVSENLSRAGAIGLEALALVEAKKAAPAGWADKQKAALAAIDKPLADVTLAAVRVVRALVEKVGK